MKHINSRNIVETEMVKTLKIKDKTHERLQKLGKYGESFDDIINRVTEFYEKNSKK